MLSKLISRILTPNSIASRSYYANKVNKVTLYSKISPLGNPSTSVVPELENWVQNGNKVRFDELQRIVRDLRKRKRFSQALEVSEWMSKKGTCVFSPTEHAVQMDLIGRVRGFASAETYFNNLIDHEKNEKTYGSLLNCYVRQLQTEKSVTHMQKMKELGFATSALAYNNIMSLYTNIGKHDKVPGVFAEMKENKISPDNVSYRICINSYGVRSDLKGVEKILEEMERQSDVVVDWNTYAIAANFYINAGHNDIAIEFLKKSEEKLENKDGAAYNFLISLYATLGNKDEVLRLWGLEKIACKRCINVDFINMLKSLVKLGEFEEAEKVLKEWESSGNCYDVRIPNIVINGYCENGMHEVAKAMLEDLMEKGKVTTPNSWVVVAAGYIEKGKVEKGYECMKACLASRVVRKGWKPSFKVITTILVWLGDKGRVEQVEEFLSLLRIALPAKRQMYHALIKASVGDDRVVDAILRNMREDKLEVDDETKTLLGTMQA